MNIATANQLEAWDRQPGEPPRAYEAFNSYLMLGAQRSLLKAYRLQPGHEQATAISGCWSAWNDKHEWYRRAQAYDAHLQKEARAKAVAAYDAKIEEYHARITALSSAALGNAVRLLDKLNERLEDLDEADITPQMIPSYLRACAAISQASIGGMAMGLGVDSLIKQLKVPDETIE